MTGLCLPGWPLVLTITICLTATLISHQLWPISCFSKLQIILLFFFLNHWSPFLWFHHEIFKIWCPCWGKGFCPRARENLQSVTKASSWVQALRLAEEASLVLAQAPTTGLWVWPGLPFWFFTTWFLCQVPSVSEQSTCLPWLTLPALTAEQTSHRYPCDSAQWHASHTILSTLAPAGTTRPDFGSSPRIPWSGLS
jgi:hypothetical protein